MTVVSVLFPFFYPRFGKLWYEPNFGVQLHEFSFTVEEHESCRVRNNEYCNKRTSIYTTFHAGGTIQG